MRRIGGRGSLQLRFMVVVVVGALLFSLAAGGIAFVLAERRALESSRHAIENLTTAVEKSLAVGAFARDRVLLDEIVGGLGGHELVRSAEVRLADGELMSSSGDSAAASSAPGTLVERALASPFDASERVGVLRLQIDMRRVAQLAVDDALLLGGLMVGQGMLVALLLYAVMAWLVSGPIVRIARTLPKMTPGSERRLEKPAYHGDDEIGLLVDAANALLDSHDQALHRERTLRAEVESMEAQYRQIFDSSSAGIFVLDGGGCLINSNPTVSRVVGMSRTQLAELQRESFVRRVFARPEKVQRMVDESAHSGRTVSGDLQLLQEGEEGRWVHCLISVQSAGQSSAPSLGQPADDPSVRTVEGVIYDVTERKFSERRVRYRAEHDALTGLKNRAATEAGIERMIGSAIAANESLSLLCIDLDGFKCVNDEFGHTAGDHVLTVCASRMKACMRSEVDLVGRIGGDEFIIALHQVAPGDPVLHRTAAALVATLCRPITLEGGQRAHVGASIGIASAPHHGSTYTALVHCADLAMYEVKRSGKNAFAVAAAPAATQTDDAGNALPFRGEADQQAGKFEMSDF